jgi:sulfatase maturation enzyme AslB (radical SAM superfamily)
VNNFDWPTGILKDGVFQGFIEQHGAFAFELYFANYGEPLLNRSLPRFVQMARRFLLPTYASTSLSIRNLDFDALVASKLNFLIVSIDGATEETYSIYRRKGNFALVIDNLKKLVEAKTRFSSYTPILQWQFLVFEHNVHEVEAVKQLARELGVNELRLVKPYAVDWDDPKIVVQADWQTELVSFHDDWQQYTSGLGKLADDLDAEIICKHFSRSWTQRLDEVSRGAISQVSPFDLTGKRCTWLYKSATMDANGRIMPCTRPPSSTDTLAFSEQSDEMHFNSEKHRLARLFFADPKRYRAETDGLPLQDVPYCSKCWHPNFKPDIDTRDIVRQHLDNNRFFGALDEECKAALTEW